MDKLNEWTYIDEFDACPDVKSVHCDTRDFHILCTNDPESDDMRRFIRNTHIDSSRRYRQDEILGYLKTLESESGGKGEWRMIRFDDNKGWRKYFRFYKIDETDTLDGKKGVYCCFAGGTPKSIVEFEQGLIDRIKHHPENIIKSADELNHIKGEE